MVGQLIIIKNLTGIFIHIDDWLSGPMRLRDNIIKTLEK